MRKTFKATALLLAGLVVVACQPGSYRFPVNQTLASGERPELSQIDWLIEPKSWVGPSTAIIESTEIIPITINPLQSLPAVIESDELSGPLSVTINSTDRILALDMSGSLAATVWALGFGDRLVGRDISTTFPGVADLPVVTGSGHAISPESVLALRPDLIITDGTIGPIDVILQLREAGVTVVFIRAQPGLD